MTQDFLCPHCGSNLWSVLRQHTLWEDFTLSKIQPGGDYEEEGSDFGETITTGEWEEITCTGCGKEAPANHPLWPTKEEPHA